MKSKLLYAAAAAALSLAVIGPVTAQQPTAPPSSLESPHYGAWGFDLSGMDRSVKPGDDFYSFASGTWARTTEIPADRVRYGNFDKLGVLTEARLRAVIEDAAAGKEAGPDAQKISNAYQAFMNEALAEQLDAKPIRAELAAVAAVKTRQDMTALMSRDNFAGYTPLMNLFVEQDSKHPDHYALYGGLAGMGLPDRDYYLDARFADQKAKYEAYIAQMLTLVGYPDPAGSAKAVLAFETRLAEASWSRIEARNPDKTYNPMSWAELQAYTPGYDWEIYRKGAELPKVERVILETNTAFPKYAKIYTETDIATLKAWQAFHVVDNAAPLLSKRFVDANWQFRSHELSGTPQQRPRWKQSVGFVNNRLGEAVGKLYVARYFPPESKAMMLRLVEDIRTALKIRIQNLDWMSPTTKAKALEKLAKITVKIGYPDKWRDYSKLEMKPDDLYGNALRSNAYEWRFQVARLNDPVDRVEWSMLPQEINAQYEPRLNTITFPAAILQAPFFDPRADPAINYGGIGGVIGHEISHGFDDEGRKSDGDGALIDWWTPADAAKFDAQAQRLGMQYDAFEPLPGFHVQGGLTMGENIGDMGGLSLALDAYRLSLGGKPAPVLDGFTGDQRVFLGWAQVWRAKIRDEALKQRLVADPHSPATYRVNGTIRNIAGWYDAWGVQPGDKLYVAPGDRVKIW